MDWKDSLDRYLTREPNDDFGSWCEVVIDNFSEEFYNNNHTWIDQYNGQSDKWLNKLFDKGKSPIDSAKIIERAFKLCE